MTPCQKALEDAGLAKSEIDVVLLVGGMTRTPMVRREVSAFFEKEPDTSVNPDEVVAMGAAVQSSIVRGELTDVLLLDVTPLTLGIETAGRLHAIDSSQHHDPLLLYGDLHHRSG